MIIQEWDKKAYFDKMYPDSPPYPEPIDTKYIVELVWKNVVATQFRVEDWRVTDTHIELNIPIQMWGATEPSDSWSSWPKEDIVSFIIEKRK